MNPAEKRLLDLARAAEEGHLAQARGAVLRQFQDVNLKAAEKAIKAALSLPRSQRPAALRGALHLVNEAARVTATPPAQLVKVIRRAVQDRALNTRDLSLLSDPSLVFPDPGAAAADAVQRQRQDMNRYWEKESRRFRDDAARTVREALRRNLPVDQAADQLQQRLNVSRSRAVLIAQDQMLTAAATAERNLLKAAGVKEFQWRTIGDNRVRTAHAQLNGRIFTWRSAPELPGQAIRCRCRAVVPPSPVPGAGATVPAMQPQAHFEQITPGTHVERIEVRGLSERQTRVVLRAATTARLTDHLRQHPLSAVELRGFSPRGLVGVYVPDTRTLTLNTARSGRTFGQMAPLGRVAAVSAKGQTKVQAIRMSFVHELGHHLIETHAPATELALNAYRTATGAVSVRARLNWQEYFCENLTAYTFFRRELMRVDPVGHKMIQDFYASLGD